MKAKATVLIKNEQKKVKVTSETRALVKKAVLAVLDFEKFYKETEVSVTFTDNDSIHKLNLQYRNIDRPTDVLSFPLCEGSDFDSPIQYVMLGDIVISLEKAVSQAEEYGHSFEREVAFLTVHSMLHLLGYDHETSVSDEKEMFAKQDAILAFAGIEK